MHPLLVLSHADSALTPFNAFALGLGAQQLGAQRLGGQPPSAPQRGGQHQGALGKPVWGASQLLRDLELRLGLASSAELTTEASRVLRWSARLQAMASAQRFYAASFAVDPLGTTQSVLALRDSLKTCGWDGSPIANGGARLDALAELESLAELPVPPSGADRALSVAAALSHRSRPVYAELTLADVETTWPECWRRVFHELKRTGTQLNILPQLEPQASPNTDLGKIQSALREESSTAGDVQLVGDGSFVRVIAETSIEAARATAALLASFNEPNTVVIREREAAVLDHALGQHGLPSQGLHSSSPWRSSLQVLPLALELAFEPKDPQRVLELLNLPQGPFTGAVARYLTRALQRSPGVGGRAWLEAKAKLAALLGEATVDKRLQPDQLPQQVALVELWLETRGADAIHGAPKNALLAVVTRVRAWLLEQVNRRPLDTILRVGVQQCDDLIQALALEHRDAIDLVHIRRLSEFVMNSGAIFELTPEEIGKFPSVGSARALYTPAANVVWWMFTHSYEHALGSPWRAAERTALAAAYIERPNLELQLFKRAAAFRRTVFATQNRLILVSPRTSAGQSSAAHPLWDELVAKVPLSLAAQAAITCSADELLRPGEVRVPKLPIERVAPLALPVAHPQWNVTLPTAATSVRHSASSLGSLLGCPLQWALTYLAGLKSEEQALTSQHLLAGSLGHRLIEVLHEAGLFTADASTFRARASEEFELLVAREGAVLLRPGKAHELSQLSRQLVNAACVLRELLTAQGLTIRSVEAAFEVPWREGQLFGRLDLLVESTTGQQLVIDVKWGHAKYRTILQKGNALQLATYGQALHGQALHGQALRGQTPSEQALPEQTSPPKNEPVVAAYYSLSAAQLFGVAPNLDGVELVRGDNLNNTWQRANRTLPLVETSVSRGQLHVSGVTRALPLLTALNVAESEWAHHYQTLPSHACEYCRYDGLCGRRWEAFR